MSSPRLNSQTFIAVAAAIKRVPRIDQAHIDALRDVTESLADIFQERAAKFDRELFVRNAGFQS
jgi:hypothetical protein